jgi:uncharacterized membrane protein YdbT with pleckstrin-like domain
MCVVLRVRTSRNRKNKKRQVEIEAKAPEQERKSARMKEKKKDSTYHHLITPLIMHDAIATPTLPTRALIDAETRRAEEPALVAVAGHGFGVCLSREKLAWGEVSMDGDGDGKTGNREKRGRKRAGRDQAGFW